MRRVTAATLSTLALLSAHAAAADPAEGKLEVKGTVSAGVAFRTAGRDTDLLPDVNSSLIGIRGTAITPTAGRNQDDGNLNFDKGDAVSKVVNAYLSLEYSAGGYGARASFKAWYDFANASDEHPWGNIPNGYRSDAPLGDSGAQARSKFGGVALDNLYVNGRVDAGGMPLEWSLGWQKLEWGNRYIVLGGLRDLNPIDIPALTRPGMLQRDQETRIPVPQIVARLGLSKTTSIEGFYQFHFERNAANQCGTFYSGVDWFSDGCNAVFVGNLNDRDALSAGSFLKRAPHVTPSNAGQFGVALVHTVESWNTKFGFYATQFHSRIGYSGVTKSLAAAGAPPFVPGDPAATNPQYYTEFPADIRMFGASFETKFQGGFAFGELTYRPNQPLQFNASDLLAAVLSPVAPTTLRERERALPPGGALSGFERHKNVQLQLGAIGQVPKVLGAVGMNWGAEFVYKAVPDLPDPAVTRFGRVDVFGQAPVNGVCPPPAVPSQCTFDGYVSRRALGFRMVAGLRYSNVWDGVDLVPSLLFGQDIAGWSGDGAILEGRRLAVASLRLNHRSGFTGELAWWPTWGGQYNNQRDRSAVQVSVGQRF